MRRGGNRGGGNRGGENRGGNGSRGGVLIFVLLYLSFFLFLGSIFGRHSLLEARIGLNFLQNIQAQYLAEGGLETALALLKTGEAGLEQGFLLEGSVPGRSFSVHDGGSGEGGGRLLVARAAAGTGLGEVRVEAAYRSLLDAGEMAAGDMDLLGQAGIAGDLHINGTLKVAGPGNLVTGAFSLSGPGAVFLEEGSVSLMKYQVTAVGEEDLQPFRVGSGRRLPSFHGDFFRGQAFPSFPRFQDYLEDGYAQADGPKRLVITGELDTAFLGEEIHFHGVIAVTAPGEIRLAGRINAGGAGAGGAGGEGAGSGEKQLILVAALGQDVRIEPDFLGQLEIGGSLLVFTRGDIRVQGPGAGGGETGPGEPDGAGTDGGGEPPGGITIRGAAVGQRLSLTGATLVYDPGVWVDLEPFLKGLAPLGVWWLKIH